MVIRSSSATSAANALVVARPTRTLIRLRAQLLKHRAGTPNLVKGLFAHVACIFGHICARAHNAFASDYAVRQPRQATSRIARLNTDLLGNTHKLRRTRRLNFDAGITTGTQNVSKQLLILLNIDAFV